MSLKIGKIILRVEVLPSRKNPRVEAARKKFELAVWELSATDAERREVFRDVVEFSRKGKKA